MGQRISSLSSATTRPEGTTTATPDSNNNKDFVHATEALSLDETQPLQLSTPTKMHIVDIPTDVMQDILSRLLVSHLFQIRYVSRTWRSLINNSNFPNLHCARMSRNANPTILILQDFLGNVYYIPDAERCEKAIKLCFPIESVFSPTQIQCYSWKILGSINGLICFYLLGHRFFICNPLTGGFGNSIALPGYTHTHPYKEMYESYYGFGWDSKNNKYKVISIRPCKEMDKFFQVNIHTLGSSTWRSIGTIPNDLALFLGDWRGIFVNGHLHWFVVNESSEAIRLWTVDMENELYGSISIPSQIQGSVQVWVMKCYGVESSWFLEFVIPHPAGFQVLKPLGMLKNGNVLVACKRKYANELPAYIPDGYGYAHVLSSYDPKTKTHEMLKVDGLPTKFIQFSHVGTFVSLKQGWYRHGRVWISDTAK